MSKYSVGNELVIRVAAHKRGGWEGGRCASPPASPWADSAIPHLIAYVLSTRCVVFTHSRILLASECSWVLTSPPFLASSRPFAAHFLLTRIFCKSTGFVGGRVPRAHHDGARRAGCAGGEGAVDLQQQWRAQNWIWTVRSFYLIPICIVTQLDHVDVCACGGTRWTTLRGNTPDTLLIMHTRLPHTRPKSPDALWSDGDTGRGSGMDNAYIDMAQSTEQHGGTTKSALRLDQMTSWEKVPPPPSCVSAYSHVHNIWNGPFVFIILGTVMS